MRQHTHTQWIALTAMVVALFVWSGLASAQATNQQQQGLGERTGQAADRAADRIGEGADRATDRMGQATDRAADQMGQTTDRAADQMSPSAARGQLPAGTDPQDLRAGEAVRDVFASLCQAALTKGNFGDVVDQFCDQDKERLRTDMPANFDDLNNSIDQFKKTWKDKYNQDFDIGDEDAIYSQQHVTLAQGVIRQPDQVKSSWPIKATGRAGMSSDQMQQQRQQQGQQAADYLKQDTKICVASFSGKSGQPDLHVSFVHQAPDFWRIDVPDNITGSQLKTSLVNHINQLNSMSGQWPSDVNEAYRTVTRHILMACYNVGSSGASTSPGQSPGQNQ